MMNEREMKLDLYMILYIHKVNGDKSRRAHLSPFKN